MKEGTVFRVVGDNRWFYVQYLGKHSRYGDAIRVFPSWAGVDTNVTRDWLNRQDSFTIFYPLERAYKESLVELTDLSTEDVPSVPTTLRRRGYVDRSGNTLSWIIHASGEDRVQKSLSHEECEIPLAAIWNHEFLLTKVASGWHPRDLT